MPTFELDYYYIKLVADWFTDLWYSHLTARAMESGADFVIDFYHF